MQLVFLTLWITFAVLAVAEWTGMAAIKVAGGYLGLLTAAFAFYLSAAEVLNETRGQTTLPTGPYAPLN